MRQTRSIAAFVDAIGYSMAVWLRFFASLAPMRSASALMRLTNAGRSLLMA